MNTLTLAIGFGLGAAAMFVIDSFTMVKFQLARWKDRKTIEEAVVKFEDLDEEALDNLLGGIRFAWEQQVKNREDG